MTTLPPEVGAPMTDESNSALANRLADRDFDKTPYSPDEKRVAAFFAERDVGGGHDPIGAMLAGYAFLAHERQVLKARLAATPAGSPGREVSLEGALRRLADDKPMASFWTFEVDVRKEFARAALSPTAPNALQPAPEGEVWQHVKRGTTYRILHEHITGSCACESCAAAIDHQPFIVYQDVDSGRVWVRPRDEFYDGRFVRAALTKGAV